MPDIIEPTAFDERFTIYLNAAGKPVQRTLHEMTADEVLMALEWHDRERTRLQEEQVALPDAAKAALDDAEAATIARFVRLMERVDANIPPRGGDMSLDKALRRYWRGGRHTAIDA